MLDKLREIRFTPYRKGLGLPTFTLRTYDTGRTDRDGKSYIAYQLVEHPSGKRTRTAEVVISDAADFCGSPMYAIDSDESIKALMGFLTLRIGDTDREYFQDYSEVQKEFRDTHAETLSVEVYSRFGWD